MSGTHQQIHTGHPGAVPAPGARAQVALIAEAAREATGFLKAMAHEGRMMILCHLASGEKSVGELEALLGQRQAAVSQQLARLRAEGLVACRREGKTRLYYMEDPRVAELMEVLYRLFCSADGKPGT
ncbi:MAG: metalloregulator ArsR/SmtB family transcription factor [Paracoccus sp. (in: a-proteobacteria)]|nr:metalloregulator ArsR/SmtB family transcription factor [Paracoccus sp. (in: a-proteobacteria)]